MFKKFFIYPLAPAHYNPSFTKNVQQFYYTGKIQRTITKMWGKHVIENLFLLFVVKSPEHVGTQSTLARKHVSAQNALPRDHASMQGTLAREHVSTQDTLVREHVSTQGRLAREHVSTQDTLAREHVSTQGTLARGHVRHTI